MFRFVAALVIPAVLACSVGCGNGSRGAPEPASTGTLAVADTRNNRVLIYEAPLTADQPASLVLGQPDFIHGLQNRGADSPAANTLALPYGVAQGPHGELFVADTVNCRVLEFVPPFRNGMSASVVIGQPDLATRNCFTLTTANASSLAVPTAVRLDSHGNLWVVDIGDARVLQYVPPFRNGMAASLVIGQTTTGASQGCNQVNGQPPLFASATPSALCWPRDLAFDSSGDLWIADIANNRILEFVPPFSTGMNASLELGQAAGPDQFIADTPNQCPYTASTCGPTSSSLFFPTAAAFDPGGNLWVADEANHRVLEYQPPFSNGMDATLVLGQPDFTSGASSGYFDFPNGLAFQQNTGKLFVCDSDLNRALVFDPPFTTNMVPGALLGQRDLNGELANRGNPTPTAQTHYFPTGVAGLQ